MSIGVFYAACGPAIINAVVLPLQEPINQSAILQAIRMVESADRDDAVGQDGERGAYQFTQDTWERHTTVPFSLAQERDWSNRIARRHLRMVIREIESHGAVVSEVTIACRWNPRASHGYAERVQNLYRDIIAHISHDNP